MTEIGTFYAILLIASLDIMQTVMDRRLCSQEAFLSFVNNLRDPKGEHTHSCCDIR